MFSWWNASGGFFYHYLALRYRNDLWRGFHDPLHQWLVSWPQKNPTLVLFGPSGGYALHKKFLDRYSTFVVVEPDPIAQAILKRRFKSVFSKKEVEWISDPTILVDKNHSTAKLKTWLEENPARDLLFCNVIGQLPLFFPKKDPTVWANWKTSFSHLMQSQNFASFHDLCSSHRMPVNWRQYSGMQLNDLSILFDSDKKTEVYDHQTQDLFERISRKHFLWRISTRRFHLIEGVYA